MRERSADQIKPPGSRQRSAAAWFREERRFYTNACTPSPSIYRVFLRARSLP